MKFVCTDNVKHAWFADDGMKAGKIAALKKWSDKLAEWGPSLGYYPKHSNCWLIVKNNEEKLEAEQVFAQIPINITIEGERHLGAVIGSENLKKTSWKLK